LNSTTCALATACPASFIIRAGLKPARATSEAPLIKCNCKTGVMSALIMGIGAGFAFLLGVGMAFGVI
jgi:hypothetical protein